jgi:hypothetical protein
MKRRSLLLAVALLLPRFIWAATNLPCGVSVDFTYDPDTSLGSDLAWTVTLVNNTNASRTCRVTLDADALAYNGEHFGDVATQFTTNTLAPGATNTVGIMVTPATYTNWTGRTRTFELSAHLKIERQSDTWIDSGRIVLSTSTDLITIAPNPPIQQGHSLTGTVSYLNPLPVSLHNVLVFMTAAGGLSTNGAFVKSTWSVGTVASNSWITVSTNYTAGQIGTHGISALITADELNEVEGNTQIEVVAP